MGISRRAVLAGLLAAGGGRRVAAVAASQAGTTAERPRFSYPIGTPGQALGDGFVVRHGYATENTWYNPGWWHAGEDWYALEGDTAGAGVYAIADGEVVFAGSEYPGLVVIVRHTDELFSMYGHLDYRLGVEEGERVERGQPLGTVLARTDGRAPSHLHVEVRTFLTMPEVNGAAPRYGVACGFECPPGPGYWPIDAAEHPSAMGWRNPTHVIAGDRTALADGVVVAARPSTSEATVRSAPSSGEGSRSVGELGLEPGERFPLLDVRAGRADGEGTSAEAYALWYRVRLPDGGSGWVRAAVPSTLETGADGRPSSVVFDFFPAVTAASP